MTYPHIEFITEKDVRCNMIIKALHEEEVIATVSGPVDIVRVNGAIEIRHSGVNWKAKHDELKRLAENVVITLGSENLSMFQLAYVEALSSYLFPKGR